MRRRRTGITEVIIRLCKEDQSAAYQKFFDAAKLGFNTLGKKDTPALINEWIAGLPFHVRVEWTDFYIEFLKEVFK